ncbi:glycosyltransferase [Alphaproteobacteria bacterium]|nr:glycosyltransferase [Alphaproteobacteria bacterium]
MTELNENKVSISVIIPTFNREQELLQLLKEVDSQGAVKLLFEIRDDASACSYNTLRTTHFENIKVVLQRNKKNVGFAENVCRLLENCESDYCVLMADDDHLLGHGVAKLNGYLRNNIVDFASTQSFVSGLLYRGSRRNKSIQTNDFMLAASRAPGLVFRVKAVSKYLSVIRERLRVDCQFASMYPQVCLLMLMLRDNLICVYLAFPIESLGFNRSSGLKVHGSPFWSIEARAKQLANACDFVASSFPLESQGEFKKALAYNFIPRLFGVLNKKKRVQLILLLLKRTVWRLAVEASPSSIKDFVKVNITEFRVKGRWKK